MLVWTQHNIDVNSFLETELSSVITGRPASNLTSDVSHRSLLPFTRLPIVMWKYVLPLLQLEILVNGYVARISCNTKMRLQSKFTLPAFFILFYFFSNTVLQRKQKYFNFKEIRTSFLSDITLRAKIKWKNFWTFSCHISNRRYFGRFFWSLKLLNRE